MKYNHIISLLLIFLIFFQFNFAPLPVFSNQNLIEKPEDTLRIVSYNIRFGAGPLFDQKISEISSYLSSIDADIICLQEVDRSTIRSVFINQPNKLRKDLFMEVAFGETDEIVPGKTGNLILSKYPIINIENTKLPSTKFARTLLNVTLDTDFGVVNIINTHLSLSKSERKEQIDIIRKTIFQNRAPTIITGDFNTTDPKELLPLSSILLDSAIVKSKDYISTFRSKRYDSRIDYIFVPDKFHVEFYDVLQFDSSDHFPIVTDIKLNKTN